MADLRLFVPKIPLLEGTNVTENDYQGHPTKFGVSTALLKDATGKTMSDDWLRGASFDDPLIQASIKFIWDHHLCSQIDSQAIAELIADHAYNTGRSRSACHFQNWLINKFGASITADGKVGAMTIGALNAAIKQHGEALVYRSFRQLRVNYYLGKNQTNNNNCKYWEGCKTSVCPILVDSRINRYFPQMGQPTADDDPEKPIGTKLQGTNAAFISAAVGSNKVPLVICVFVLVMGLCYYFLKPPIV